MLKGIGISAGIGIGKAFVFKQPENDSSSKGILFEDAKRRLEGEIKNARKSAEGTEAEILDGYISILNDTVLNEIIQNEINNGCPAKAAVKHAFGLFSNNKDINNISAALQLLLEKTDVLPPFPKGSVLVIEEFTPLMLDYSRSAAAVIAESGGITSHSAILLRAKGVPSVFSVKGATEIIKNKDLVIADGINSEVIVSPDIKTLRHYEKEKQKQLIKNKALQKYKSAEVKTKSGRKIGVFANINTLSDIPAALSEGCDGIGLIRTEFLFGGNIFPSEEEQFNIYSEIVKSFSGKDITFRAFDFSADKFGKSKKRGTAFLLSSIPLFTAQLKALLRASAFGNVKLLLPYITQEEEFLLSAGLLKKCKAELEGEGTIIRNIPLGAMVETAAAANISERISKHADFISIGSNDLTSELLGISRKEITADYILAPEIIDTVKGIVKNAEKNGIRVSLCGEAAADKAALPALIGAGIDIFSVSPLSVLSTKKAIIDICSELRE